MKSLKCHVENSVSRICLTKCDTEIENRNE